jgi:hypothetical protein
VLAVPELEAEVSPDDEPALVDVSADPVPDPDADAELEPDELVALVEPVEFAPDSAEETMLVLALAEVDV